MNFVTSLQVRRAHKESAIMGQALAFVHPTIQARNGLFERSRSRNQAALDINQRRRDVNDIMQAPMQPDSPAGESLLDSVSPGGIPWGGLFNETIALAKAVGSIVRSYESPTRGMAKTIETLRGFHGGAVPFRAEILRAVSSRQR